MLVWILYVLLGLQPFQPTIDTKVYTGADIMMLRLDLVIRWAEPPVQTSDAPNPARNVI